MDAKAIAEELEENVDVVEEIYDIAKSSDMTDVERIYQIYKNKRLNPIKQ